MLHHLRLSYLLLGLGSGLFLSQAAFAAQNLDIPESALRPAIRSSTDFQPAPPLAPKNLPDFPRLQIPANSAANTQSVDQPTSTTTAPVDNPSKAFSGSGSALRSEAASTTLPLETRLKLVLETSVDAKTSRPGDVFEAHVKDDLFVGSNLVLARGSQVRGRVSEVTKPRFISRAGRIGLRLDQIVTPSGEVVPLDAGLEFRKGMTNKKGQLDPGTNFGTRVDSSIKAASGMSSTGVTKGAIVAANIATLGTPTIAAALGGGAIALFSSGDNVCLDPGQEIEVLLTNDLGVQVN